MGHEESGGLKEPTITNYFVTFETFGIPVPPVI